MCLAGCVGVSIWMSICVWNVYYIFSVIPSWRSAAFIPLLAYKDAETQLPAVEAAAAGCGRQLPLLLWAATADTTGRCRCCCAQLPLIQHADAAAATGSYRFCSGHFKATAAAAYSYRCCSLQLTLLQPAATATAACSWHSCSLQLSLLQPTADAAASGAESFLLL